MVTASNVATKRVCYYVRTSVYKCLKEEEARLAERVWVGLRHQTKQDKR